MRIKIFLALLMLALLWPVFPGPGYAANEEAIELVPVVQDEVSDTSTAKRKRAQVSLTLADPAANFTQAQLAATCMAAAKYYARAHNLQALSVFITDIPGSKSWEGTFLARCDYSPDKGGWSGDQGWLWDQVQAVTRPLTDAERQMKKLWGEGRGKKIAEESEVAEYVAKKMGIKPEDVTLLSIYPEKVDYREFEGIAEHGPAKSK